MIVPKKQSDYKKFHIRQIEERSYLIDLKSAALRGHHLNNFFRYLRDLEQCSEEEFEERMQKYARTDEMMNYENDDEIRVRAIYTFLLRNPNMKIKIIENIPDIVCKSCKRYNGCKSFDMGEDLEGKDHLEMDRHNAEIRGFRIGKRYKVRELIDAYFQDSLFSTNFGRLESR